MGSCLECFDNFLKVRRYFIKPAFTDRIIPADGIFAVPQVGKALVRAVVKRSTVREDCDLVAERLSFVRAEDRAVSAFVADAVDMDDLLLAVDFEIFIAAVRAGFHAHTAESAAFQTAGRIAFLIVRIEDRAFAQAGIFAVQNSIFRIITAF